MSDDLPDWDHDPPRTASLDARVREILWMYCRGDERFARGLLAFVEDCERDDTIPEAFHSFCKHFRDTAIGSQGLELTLARLVGDIEQARGDALGEAE